MHLSGAINFDVFGHPRVTWVFKGLGIIFPNIVDEIWLVTNVRLFLILSPSRVWIQKFEVPFFSTKNILTWEVKCVIV